MTAGRMVAICFLVILSATNMFALHAVDKEYVR